MALAVPSMALASTPSVEELENTFNFEDLIDINECRIEGEDVDESSGDADAQSANDNVGLTDPTHDGELAGMSDQYRFTPLSTIEQGGFPSSDTEDWRTSDVPASPNAYLKILIDLLRSGESHLQTIPRFPSSTSVMEPAISTVHMTNSFEVFMVNEDDEKETRGSARTDGESQGCGVSMVMEINPFENRPARWGSKHDDVKSDTALDSNSSSSDTTGHEDAFLASIKQVSEPEGSSRTGSSRQARNIQSAVPEKRVTGKRSHSDEVEGDHGDGKEGAKRTSAKRQRTHGPKALKGIDLPTLNSVASPQDKAHEKALQKLFRNLHESNKTGKRHICPYQCGDKVCCIAATTPNDVERHFRWHVQQNENLASGEESPGFFVSKLGDALGSSETARAALLGNYLGDSACPKCGFQFARPELIKPIDVGEQCNCREKKPATRSVPLWLQGLQLVPKVVDMSVQPPAVTEYWPDLDSLRVNLVRKDKYWALRVT